MTTDEKELMENAPPSLLVMLREKVGPELVKEFGYKSVMEIPRLEKVVINIGLGESLQNNRAMERATEDIALITGQKPVVTRAKKSIAGFKIREGYPIGCKVTLRRDRMYEFVERLLSIAIPRIRDFRGLNPRSFDGRGNFSMGLSEQIVFTEIDYDRIDKIRGLDITVTTSASTNAEALALLRALDFPFRS